MSIQHRSWIRSTLSMAAFGIALAGISASAATPPTNTSGETAKLLASLNLGPEIPGMEGRMMRAVYIVLAPGAVTAAHSHDQRPEIIYVLKGVVTEYQDREGRTFVAHPAGEAFSAGKDRFHWFENKTAEAVTMLAVQIAK